MITEQRIIRTDGAELAGELTLPNESGQVPTVIMIHGSGPLDRNENTRGQSLNIFNTFAEHLCATGIASFRYDKRGCGKSSGDYFLAGHRDLVDDASACVDALGREERCDPERVYVLGHSEGTIIAAQLAARHPALAGLVLLCPFVEPMDSILRRQARQMRDDLANATGIRRLLYASVFAVLGDPVENQEKLLARLRATDDPTFRVMLQKVNARWLRELIALDSEQIYSQLKTSVLAIGGEKDIQCLPDDVAKIAEVSPSDVSTHVIANLTHLLRFESDEPSFLNYGKLLKRPMENLVCELVSNWISRH